MPASSSGAGPQPLLADGAVLEAIDHARMWRDLEFLCGINRTSGTEGERRAMAYIADRLREVGLAVEVAAFDAYLSYPIAGAIEVLAGDGLPARIAAKTRAFSATTSPEGVAGDVVYVSGGHDLFRDMDTHRRLDPAAITGRIVLSEAGSRRNMQAAQDRGALAYLHMWPSGEDAIHEGIVSPVWGTPTPESTAAFPRIPILGITNASGLALREAAERGSVAVRVHSRTETGWRPVTLPVATVGDPGGDFVLFSGHVDSWHLGATDNATGNVVTMEVARILHAHRDRLHRGVRFAFWPGHSTGRYAGSTWYADHHWQELYDHCVLHINCDSPGVQGATEYEPVTASAEAAGFAVDLIRELTGQTVASERPVRAGDQSFWGAGVPSLLMGLSVRPKGQRWAVGGSGLAWWWHTEADTIDKVDPQVLHRDTAIYLAAAYRVAAAPVPPLLLADAVHELASTLAGSAGEAGGRVDLEPIRPALARLRDAASAFDAAAARAHTGGEAAMRGAAALSRIQRDADRHLVQAAYVGGSPFDHDPAIPQPAVPALRETRDLAEAAGDHDARLLATRLLRRRNQIIHHLTQAAVVLERGLADLPRH